MTADLHNPITKEKKEKKSKKPKEQRDGEDVGGVYVWASNPFATLLREGGSR